ncbi:MAG: hypothetical protein GWO39_14590, partial [Gammaproteobacteria bacterium]|nr:hypothetical protein [Gammaproteobacteria bacterium]NIV21904.1 hypothetical protein [Gammaproteobacteria bacterium]NIY33512.1 hypothetical protein [Gammaproteobacteria bacterium]
VELATTGTIELLDRVAPVFDLQNAFSHISFGDWLLRDGAVNLEGTLEAYRMQFKALASSPRLPTARVEGTATGNPDGLESLDLLAEAGTAAVLAA